MKTPTDTPLFDVTLSGFDHTLFRGQAHAISSMNAVGVFDILPFHAGFISVIHTSVTIHTDEGKKEFPLTTGILRCSDRSINIYVQS